MCMCLTQENKDGCMCEELKKMEKSTIWNKIHNIDFKWFILTNYNWWEINEELLKKLVEFHRKAFGLKVKI